jgi:hypothetical protein
MLELDGLWRPARPFDQSKAEALDNTPADVDDLGHDMSTNEWKRPRPKRTPTKAEADYMKRTRTKRKLANAKAARKAWQAELKELRLAEQTRRYARQARETGMSEQDVLALQVMMLDEERNR